MTAATEAPALRPTELTEAARRLDLLGLHTLADALGSDADPELLRLAGDLLDADVATLTRAAAVGWLETVWLPEDEQDA